MRRVRIGVLVAIVVAGSAGAMGSAAAQTLQGGGGAVCAGGPIASGTYSQLTVTGVCTVPTGIVTVTGNLRVSAGALLDATTPSLDSSLPGTVVVDGNVLVGSGAVLFLGCDAAILCPSGSTIGSDRVGGNVIAVGALGVVVHAVTIDGNVTIVGGGGGAAMLSPGCLGTPAPSPWSRDPGPLASFPVYMDLEDSTVGGNVQLVGVQSCWLGALRNTVSGNILDIHNQMGDPDANEVVGNTTHGNLLCMGSTPAVQFGDTGAAPNQVGGQGIGQCAFDVYSPDPHYDGGGPQPIAVPLS